MFQQFQNIFIYILIENMISIAKPLQELILACVNSEVRLQPYKLSEKQLAEVFIWLDQRRRGSVDVSDLYTKFLQLTESELFFVFKLFDTERKGAFTFQNLRTAVGAKNIYSNQKDDAVKNFTNLIKVLKATFHSIQDSKIRFGITDEYLQKLFFKATLRKQQIQLQDLLLIFRESKFQVDQKIYNYLERTIFNGLSLNLKQFIQVFALINLDQAPQQIVYEKVKNEAQIPATYLKSKTLEKAKNSQIISNDIEKILLKYKKQDHYQQPKNNQPLQQNDKMQQQSINGANLTKQLSQKPQSYYSNYLKQNSGGKIQIKKSPQLSLDQKYFKMRTNPQYQSKMHHEGEFMANEPSKEINQRREELRRGSLQRQKIIDDIVNKKRMFNANAFSNASSNKASKLTLNTKYEEFENESLNKYNSYVAYQPSFTPTASSSKPFYQTSNIQPNTSYGKLYDNLFLKTEQFSRPASVSKSSNYRQSGKIANYQRNLRPEISQFYRKRAQTPKNNFEKQNILKRAEEEATKKIQQIERRARLKVMEKRSAAGVYNRWLK